VFFFGVPGLYFIVVLYLTTKEKRNKG